MSTIAENIRTIRETMAEAARQAGRDPSEIRLCAATKMNDAAACQEAIAAGIDALGENRVQEMTAKLAQNAYDGAPLHFIGHLQRNKIKYIIDKVDLIHSVDSLRLAEAIEKEAAKKHVIAKVLIEVNVGREESKFGFLPEELDDFVEKASDFSHIQFMGLMTSAPFVDNPEENRPIFAELRKLSVDIARKNAHNMSMSILSMGMTNDYEVAIEEGATMVRVGTAIFGARNYAQTNVR